MESPVAEKNEKKVYLETFGCQSNVLESDHVTSLLLKDRFSLTDQMQDADVILFNTCSVRQHAEDKIFSRLGELHDWKKDRQGRVIGILGCMATSYKQQLLDRVPHLDLVLGPDQYPKAPLAIRTASRMGMPQLLADFDPVYFPENDPNHLSFPHKAFIEIMKGCDKFCTFCVVPFTRGREVSRNADDIVKETQTLVASGIKEVMLLGQNVNSYGINAIDGTVSTSFPQLLKRVGEVPGIQRVRYMTSHPLDLSNELIEVMATTPSVCEMIHLPVQCGSDTVLKRMNRKYSVAHYLERVRALRSRIPDLAITTDLIVGFPGETEEDFQGTLRLLEEVRYDLVYSFKYSPRLGTPAARMLNQVEEDVMDERLKRLNEVAWKHAAERYQTSVGKVEEVLVEGPADKTPDAFYGKTRQNRTVVFTSDKGKTADNGYKAGDFVKVRIERNKIACLYGTTE